MMSRATLTSKGQLTLPKDVRDRLGLKTGDKLDCVVSGEDEITLRRRSLDVSDLIGILHVPGKRATIEDMNRAAEDAAIERVMGGLREP